MWEGGNGDITAGFEAVKAGTSYDAESIFPVSHGRPVDIEGYVLLAQHALKSLGLENRTDICIVMGLPYDASSQVGEIQGVFEKKLKIAKCIMEPQARGTLRIMKESSAVIYNIGYGTTEATIFDQSRVVEGASLPQAVNTIFNGLRASGADVKRTQMGDRAIYEKYEKESRPFAGRIARAIQNWHADKMVTAKHEYTVIMSGGGIKNPVIEGALRKAGMDFKVPEDPMYSNVMGHFERAVRNC